MGKREQRLVVRTASGIDDVSACLMIRAAVFVGEDGCRVSEEADGNDFCATHVIATVDGEPAGTMRIRYFGGFAALERMAILKAYRRQRIDGKIMAREIGRFAVSHCRAKGYERFFGVAREGLVGFWQKFAPDGGRFDPVPGLSISRKGLVGHVMEGTAPPQEGAVRSARQYGRILGRESELA